MLSEELKKKIRWIQFSSRRLVESTVSGSYRSHFQGQGMQFADHRLYLPGDDVRHIDWKVSARTREPYLKKYEEERELIVFLIADLSLSHFFGSQTALKSEVISTVGGLLAYAAVQAGDRVGLLTFSGQVEAFLRPQKSFLHASRLTQVLLEGPSQKGSLGTALKEALEKADRVMKHRGIIFLLSDFLATDYALPLQRLARRHDVVAFRIQDDREQSWPATSCFPMWNPETKTEYWVEPRSANFQKMFQETRERLKRDGDQFLKQHGIEYLVLSPQEAYVDRVVQFFRTRRQRRSGGATKKNLGAVGGLLLGLLGGLLSIPVLEAKEYLLQYAHPERRVQVGDRVLLKIAESPPELEGQALKVQLPASAQALWFLPSGDFKEGQVEVVPLRPGKQTLPSLFFHQEGKAEALGATQPLEIQVESSIAQDDPRPQQPEGVLPPVSVSFPVSFLVGVLIVLMSLAFGLGWFFLALWKKRHKSFLAPPTSETQGLPLLSPHEEALQDLQALADSPWLEQGEWKRFYFRMSDILKRYVSRRYEVDGLESTTRELLELLSKPLGHEEQGRHFFSEIAQCFEEMDWVKFTDRLPEKRDAQFLLKRVQAWVHQTQPLSVKSVSEIEGSYETR